MSTIRQLQDKLRNEVIEIRKNVTSDTLNFSVGEIVNLYRDEEIDLEPAFQRLFRWTTEQQSQFIESLLLGYPVPSIFVYQKEDGVWEVIDGVQRISTLIHFVGLLGEPLVLEGTKLLKELNGKCWDVKCYEKLISTWRSENGELSFLDKATTIDLKRSRIPVILLDNRSHPLSKFELFKRLNSGGSHLTNQELRNALILMINENVYNSIETLATNERFKSIIGINETTAKIRFDMEIITRYLILANHKILKELEKEKNLEDYLDKAIEHIVKENFENISLQLENFKKIINFIYENLDPEYSFKKYNTCTSKYQGQFSWFIFETVIYGLLNHIEKLNIGDNNEKLSASIKNINWPSIQGKRSVDRMLTISKKLGEEQINLG